MDIKAEYNKLGDVQKKYIDDHVQDAINGIDGMRGVNDSDASPIHAWLNSIYSELCDLQDAVWFKMPDCYQADENRGHFSECDYCEVRGTCL